MNDHNFYDIFVDRCGITKNSYMKTVELMNIIQPDINYKISYKGLIKTHKSASASASTSASASASLINKVVFEAKWIYADDPNALVKTTVSNILGIDGTLETNLSELNIPLTPTSAESVAYYNCKLVKIDDIISFDTQNDLPLTYMKIGPDYVDNFIYKKGGGVYLEYHNTPHFHMPVNDNCKGYLILGKKKESCLELSAFSIPYGYGIIMNPYVIHNDCFLIGDYMVVYTKTNDYSTVTLKDKDSNMLKVNINTAPRQD